MERVSREMVRRLPALAGARYAVVRPPRGLAHRAGQLWEQGALPVIARTRRAALLLCPANLAPLAFGRNVVMIYDAAALRDPSWYSPAYARWQRELLPRIARRAVRVIVPSTFAAGEVTRFLGADPQAVSVVPLGVDERFAPGADAERARGVLGLERPYVLTVASRTARKNLGALERTAAALAAEGIDLVAAGGERPQFREAGPAAAGVRPLGPVDDALLPGLYAGASAFVLPSRHEGFGLTALEAMASGVPSVVTRAGALEETCADGARYADPDDPEGIAAEVLAALGDEALAARGRARAAGFTWEETAAGVDAVVARALAGR